MVYGHESKAATRRSTVDSDGREISGTKQETVGEERRNWSRKLHGDEADICSKMAKSGGEVHGGMRPRLAQIPVGRKRPAKLLLGGPRT